MSFLLKKCLFFFSLLLGTMVFAVADAQEVEEVQPDIVVSGTIDTLWKTQYRATPELVNKLVHTKLQVSFDYDKSYLYGKAWITLEPYFYTTDSLLLDAKGMDIKTVALSEKGGNSPLKYTYANDMLKIQLNKAYKKGQRYTIFIDYVAKPNEWASHQPKGKAIADDKGLYFINPKGTIADKPIQIWTQGETEANSVWFPTIDKPNQKMTHEISMTVPDKYVTLSNGLLMSSKKIGNGLRVDTWKMNLPHAPYLVFMGVGDFAVIKDKYKNIPVDYYVEKSYANVAKAIFGLTPEMLSFFSKKLGVAYPWAKYAQMVVRDYVSGAMENTTATLHQVTAQQNARELTDGNRWEDVIVHEIFHHWFGDLVTTESWSNLTLNESFANYSEYLWREYKYGKESADGHLYEDRQQYLSGANFKKDLVRFYYRRHDDMFDGVSYSKGGCILHMLRNFVGDDAFYTALNLFLNTHKFGTAEAQELRLAFEKVTGKDLNWFFNQWYYANGHPAIDVKYSFENGKVIIALEQKQKDAPIFTLPIDIDVYNGSKVTRHKVWMTQQKETFSFAVARKPDLVNIDADKVLLMTTNYYKSLEEYIFQYRHAKGFLNRREAVAFALENIEQPGAKNFLLQEALKDTHHNIRMMVLGGLNPKLLTENDLKEIEVVAQKDNHRPTKALGIEYLGYLQNPKYVQLFLDNVKDSSYSVAGAALKSLFYIDKEKGISLLPELRKDAKGKLASVIEKIDLLGKTDADLEGVLSTYTSIRDMNEKAEFTVDMINYLMRLRRIENFRKAVDEIVRFRDELASQYPPYKNVVNSLLMQILQQKQIAKVRDTEPTSIQEQVDYLQKVLSK